MNINPVSITNNRSSFGKFKIIPVNHKNRPVELAICVRHIINSCSNSRAFIVSCEQHNPINITYSGIGLAEELCKHSKLIMYVNSKCPVAHFRAIKKCLTVSTLEEARKIASSVKRIRLDKK